MRTLIAIIEDPSGNVIGCSTDKGDVMLSKEDVLPRAQLKAVAINLASKYSVQIPAELLPVVTPPSTPALNP